MSYIKSDNTTEEAVVIAPAMAETENICSGTVIHMEEFFLQKQKENGAFKHE